MIIEQYDIIWVEYHLRRPCCKNLSLLVSCWQEEIAEEKRNSSKGNSKKALGLTRMSEHGAKTSVFLTVISPMPRIVLRIQQIFNVNIYWMTESPSYLKITQVYKNKKWKNKVKWEENGPRFKIITLLLISWSLEQTGTTAYVKRLNDILNMMACKCS